MISINLQELISSAGNAFTLEGDKNAASDTFTQTKSLLKNKAISDRVSTVIKAAYQDNALASLYEGLVSTTIIRSLQAIIGAFLNSEVPPATVAYNDSPMVSPTAKRRQDPLVVMLEELYKNCYATGFPGVHVDVLDVHKTPTAKVTGEDYSRFLSNCSLFLIDIPQEVAATLDEADMAAIYGVGGQYKPKTVAAFVSQGYESKFKGGKMPVYTGVDMQVIFMTPNVISVDMQLKVLTYSMHSGLIPVGVLGYSGTNGFANGDRNIAGTMIATLSLQDPFMGLQPLNYASSNNYAKATSDVWRTYLMPDQFPPFDILITFSNEYGFGSVLPIFGVKLTDMGSVIAMSDSEIEVTYTYTALDMDILRTVEQNEDGTVTFDPLSNNEYLMKRQKAYNGESEHRSTAEVPFLYGRLDTRAREIGYARMRNERQVDGNPGDDDYLLKIVKSIQTGKKYG